MIQDEVMWDLHMGSLKYPLLLAADNLGFFDNIEAEASTSDDLSKRLKVGERFLRVCLGVFGSMGFLNRSNELIYLTDTAKRYLLKTSRYYWGGMFEMGRKNFPIFNEIVKEAQNDYERNTSGGHAFVAGWVTGELDPKIVRGFTAAMQSQSLTCAEAYAQSGAFKQVKRLLDIGAGSGCYSLAITKAEPEIECTLFDFAEVTEIAGEYARAENVNKRVKYFIGDFFKKSWPSGHDAVFLSHILHDWDDKRCLSILERAFASLPRGGKVFLNENLLANDLSGPENTLFYSLMMLIRTKGKQFSANEINLMLQKVGFSRFEVVVRSGYSSLLMAKKVE